MLSTSGLLNRFIEEGRADKAEALNTFIELAEDREAEDLYPDAPEEDADVLYIDNAWHVAPDHNWN